MERKDGWFMMWRTPFSGQDEPEDGAGETEKRGVAYAKKGYPWCEVDSDFFLRRALASKSGMTSTHVAGWQRLQRFVPSTHDVFDFREGGSSRRARRLGGPCLLSRVNLLVMSCLGFVAF